MNKKLVVFVHGWSVTDIDTYGEFPARLKREAHHSGLDIDVHNIWIGEYISFHDEVRMPDLVKAFQRAIQKKLGTKLRGGDRFVCITHSTGGPVVRSWWHKYYLFGSRRTACPMSHLIMLAPANFGSALAQLGKGTLGKLRSLFEGIEPGTGVLNWLELGSSESWALNKKWIDAPSTIEGDAAVYPFVLVGQSIDRAFYDHLNSYTGEMGSDGVVRVAAANLNSTYLRLEQERLPKGSTEFPNGQRLKLEDSKSAEATAFAIVKGMAHSGKDMGILRSVPSRRRRHPTVDLVLDCLLVGSTRDYRSVVRRFAENNRKVIDSERVEVEDRHWPLSDRYYVHDRCSMVVFRLQDNEGYPVEDFRLLLTAEDNDPDRLPNGFLLDRQKNRRDGNTLTYYFNYDAMFGAGPAGKTIRGKRKIIRDRFLGARRLGLEVTPEPSKGFAHYLPATLNAKVRFLGGFMKAHQTTLVDVVVHRVVRESTFELANSDEVAPPRSFKHREPEGEILD